MTPLPGLVGTENGIKTPTRNTRQQPRSDRSADRNRPQHTADNAGMLGVTKPK